MATRNISTRLAVEGESQYKAAITSINAELKNMQSALKMTESQFKSNANSTEALTAKGKALNDLLATQKSKVTALEAGLKNAQEAEARYAQKKEELTRKIQQNSAALEKLKTSTGDTTKEQQRLEEENAKLNQELERNENYLNAAHRAVNNWQTSLNNAKTEVNNTEEAIRQNSEALEENEGAAQGASGAIDALAVALLASGLKKGFDEIANALRECVDASVAFESAMAGVKRTVGGGDEFISGLGESFKEMSTVMPITTGELAKIAETAGQLGIKQENVEQFTTVMAKLATTTDLTAENAATMLAQFANITGVTDYERLGAVVAELGDATATTASKVVDMSQGMAAAASVAGMNERDILAISAAVGSLGIEAQAGSTAMSTLISTLFKATEEGGENLEKFASVANMSAEEFQQAWATNAVGALDAFIQGLNDTERNGKSAIMLLDDLGIKNVRQTKAILGLAQAGDLLSNTIAQANNAWEKNTALGEKAAIMYDTTEAKITMYKNSVDNLKIAVGDQLTPALGELAETGTDVVQWATEFVQQNEWLGPTLVSVATAVGVVTAAVGGAAVTIKVIIPLLASFNATLLANPAFWVVTAIAAVTAAAITLAKTLPSATVEADKLNKSLGDAQSRFESAQQTFDDTSETISATSTMINHYIDRLDELGKKSSLTKSEQGEYNAIVAQLQQLLPDVNFVIDETTGKLANTTEELRAGAQAWEEYARQQAFATIMKEQIDALNDLGVSLEKGRMKLAEYNASASEGTLKFAEALREKAAAWEEYDRIGMETGYDTADARFAEVQERYASACNEAARARRGLSREEKNAAKDIVALEESIGETEAAMEQQAAAIEKTQTAMQEYQQTVNEAAEKTSEMASDLEQANEVVGSIGDGAAESAQAIPEAMGTAMADTSAAVEEAAPEIQAQVGDIGTQSASEFESGLQGASDAARQTMSDVNQTVRSAAADARSAGYSVGAAISQGAAAGVRAYAAQVAAEAAQMVTDAINAAKNAAQSASPSKKMIRLGQDIDRGLIVGIKDLETEVLQQMRGTMGKVVTVQVDPPEIPDYTDSLIRAMAAGAPKSSDAALVEEFRELTRELKKPRVVDFTQNVYSEETSYAGQQREAKRLANDFARRLNG